MSARKKIRIGLCCPVRRAGSLGWSPVSRSPACCRSFAARRSAPPNSSSATRRSSCASRTRSHLIMKPKSNRASPQGLKPFTYARSNGTAEEAAEKRHLPCVLKGRTFRCAVQVLSSCHSEWASAHEESAFRTFSAASEAASIRARLKLGLQPLRELEFWRLRSEFPQWLKPAGCAGFGAPEGAPLQSNGQEIFFGSDDSRENGMSTEPPGF